jgi:hypothetical protein
MIITPAPTEPDSFKSSVVLAVRSGIRNWGAATMMLGIVVLVAGCSTSSRENGVNGVSHAPVAVTTDGHSPASQYLAIAVAGNNRLEIDFDQLSGRDRDRLSPALADLNDASATERLFDRRLLMIAFPPAVKVIAEELYAVNESRAKLSAEAAMSRTLVQLRGYESRLSAANVPVEREVRLVRSSLDLPPPNTS